MRARLILLTTATAVAAACTPGDELATTTTTEPSTTSTTAAESLTTEEILAQLGGELCPDSEFTCVTVEVPADHDDPTSGSIEVTFAVLPASGETSGAFVTATGGPGVAGISAADAYTAFFDPAITEAFDVVFFDQRGTTLSGGLTCPEAAVAWYRADPTATTPADEQALVAAASTFADDCATETGSPELLEYLATTQAVEDLEMFRELIGWEQIVLYGESYGTQFAQTYAAAHPDRLDRLILDGTVDLTMTGFEYFEAQTAAAQRTLDWTLAACDEDPVCAGDMGSAAASAYDRLAALLAEEPLTVDFPLPDGGTAGRSFGAADLEVVTAGQMYGEDDRMLFLRTLAAYGGRDDLVPMLRILYPNLGVDAASEQVIPDPTYSDAVYYGVECLDYAYRTGTEAEAAEAFLRAGDAGDGVALASLFYGDLPCVSWPYAPVADIRPAPLVAEGIPTLVLGAEADPATPYEGGLAVAERLADGHVITQHGGPHVIFGRGNACPDEAVTEFIVDGTLPPDDLECDGTVVTEYLPLLPETAAGFASAEDAMLAIENEVWYLPEFYYWDGIEDTAAGCSLGGALSFISTDAGYAFGFDGCALAEGLVLDGTGGYDAELDVFTLDVTVGDGDCFYAYAREGDSITVEDDCDADPFG